VGVDDGTGGMKFSGCCGDIDQQLPAARKSLLSRTQKSWRFRHGNGIHRSRRALVKLIVA
jgi:hypothetical protein